VGVKVDVDVKTAVTVAVAVSWGVLVPVLPAGTSV
jgi:hypothetical protein